MNLVALREALREAAAAVVVDVDVTWLAYVPDDVDPPCGFVQPDTITYDQAYGRGLVEVRMFVTVVVSRTDDQAAQELLDAFLAGAGAGSVKAAIEAARGAPGELALDGTCHDVHVPSVEAYRWFEVGGTEYLGARWTVRCIGTGS